VGTALNDATSPVLHKSNLAGIINETNAEMRAAVRGEILGSLLKDGREVDAGREIYRDRFKTLSGAVAEMRPLLLSERGRRANEAIDGRLKEFGPIADEIERLCKEGRVEEANQLNWLRSAMKWAKPPLKLEFPWTSSQPNAARDGAGTTASSRWIALLLTALAIAVSGVVPMVLRNVNGSLHRLAAEMAGSAAQLASAAGQVSSVSQSLAQAPANRRLRWKKPPPPVRR